MFRPAKRNCCASLLKYKQMAPVSIGPTRKQLKDAADRAEEAHIRKVHDEVWALRETCQLCFGARCANRDADQMHEDPPRSATRGMPPEVRFNTRVCARLCARCHPDVTENRIRIAFLVPALGFNGPIAGVKLR